MLVEDLLALRSLEGEGTVADWVEDKAREPWVDEDLAEHRAQWPTLRDLPVTVLDHRTLTDGHHRVMVAVEQGERDLPVTHIESGRT